MNLDYAVHVCGQNARTHARETTMNVPPSGPTGTWVQLATDFAPTFQILAERIGVNPEAQQAPANFACPAHSTPLTEALVACRAISS